MSSYISSDLRKLVRNRAEEQCEYCLLPESAAFISHQIDHTVAVKHGGGTEAENLALSCAVCNKHKGTDLTSIDPDSGEIVPLYHPQNDLWHDHFCVKDGEIVPLPPVARVTINLLQINNTNRVAERLILIESGQLIIKR